MAQGQCFAYCGVSWKFVACPCLRNFHGATTAAAWINCPGITFHITAEIISFSTEFSSLTEVRQLLSEGPSLNSWQPPRNDNIFPNNPRLEIQNWDPFANAPKRAHDLMPSFMKGPQSRCHCRTSHVLSGRPSIGKSTSAHCSSPKCSQDGS